jgi:TorA maturation chaperone TorD
MPEGFVLPQMAKDGTTLNQASQQRADEFGVQMLFLAWLELNVPRMMSR